jgi:hypothetical protein
MKSQLDMPGLAANYHSKSIDRSQATGKRCFKREQEMADELEDSLSIYGQYSQLQERYQYTLIQLEDALQHIENLKRSSMH